MFHVADNLSYMDRSIMTEEHAPRVNVIVSSEEIDFAIPRDSSHCMIAEAVRAAYPGAQYVTVDLQTIRFTDITKQRRYTYLTPRLAQLALIHFDQGVKPEPFKFQLRTGQVTISGRQYERPSKKQTEKGRAASAANAQKAKDSQQGNVKLRQKLVAGTGGSNQSPEKIGGKTPPITSFARRRTFGLRALGDREPNGGPS
jgi:hypothetical protein